MFRKTSLRRAIAEAAAFYLTGRLLAMVPATSWPVVLFPAALVLRLVLEFSPPVWAAMRVKSTRREKMSLRFWKLGPQLAALCVGVDAAVALALGDATLLGGAAGPPDLLRLIQPGHAHLSLLAFVAGEAVWLCVLALYFTLAVICTRL